MDNDIHMYKYIYLKNQIHYTIYLGIYVSQSIYYN